MNFCTKKAKGSAQMDDMEKQAFQEMIADQDEYCPESEENYEDIDEEAFEDEMIEREDDL